MVLDALFVAVFKWGLIGAAAATVLSQCVGGIIPIIYFALPNSSLLKITKPVFDGKALIKICTNGSSELMSNIIMSLVSMLYNIELLQMTMRERERERPSEEKLYNYINICNWNVYIFRSHGKTIIIIICRI